MGYRLVTTEQLGAIWAQLKIGESHRAIARYLGIDRKTVNHYAERILELKIPPEARYSEALGHLVALRVDNAKPKPSLAVLAAYEDEIRLLIAGDRKAARQPMKAKTAWTVIKEQHSLETGTSYESFKRFVRERGIGNLRPGRRFVLKLIPAMKRRSTTRRWGFGASAIGTALFMRSWGRSRFHVSPSSSSE